MIKCTKNEIKFLNQLEECRIATSHQDIPHVKPVSYIFNNGKFIIAVDYDTRTFKNVQKNPRAALTVDIYKQGGHQAVVIQGTTEIIEEGKEFLELYQNFFEKFSWVRDEPWKEKEAPFLKITPTRKVSWGIN